MEAAIHHGPSGCSVPFGRPYGYGRHTACTGGAGHGIAKTGATPLSNAHAHVQSDARWCTTVTSDRDASEPRG